MPRVPGHRAMSDAEQMREALQMIHDWRGLCDSSKFETWERIASDFYRDTGFLRPGKSYPMDCQPDEKEQSAAWKAWVTEQNAKVDDAIRAALEDDTCPVCNAADPVNCNHPEECDCENGVREEQTGLEDFTLVACDCSAGRRAAAAKLADEESRAEEMRREKEQR